MIFAPFRKQNAFNYTRKDEKVGKDLVDSMLNILWSLEMANVFQLFTDYGFQLFTGS